MKYVAICTRTKLIRKPDQKDKEKQMQNKIYERIPNANADLPQRIGRLNELAYNLWWAWNPDAISLYRQLNLKMWDNVSHDPIEMLQNVSPAALKHAAEDPEYLKNYDRVLAEFDAYMNQKETWFTRNYPQHTDKSIAYLSFEFGLHESIPAYAGGLGILAGDHLKESSDMGLPLNAIGFIYNQGYFVQKIIRSFVLANFFISPSVSSPKPFIIVLSLTCSNVSMHRWR